MTEPSKTFWGFSIREDRDTRRDLLMIYLALLSILLLVIDTLLPLDSYQEKAITYLDLLIVGVFIWEFWQRLKVAENKIDFVIEHWYDIIGMIPAAHPLLRSFRLFRLMNVLVIGARVNRIFTLTFGLNILNRILIKYRNVFVDALYLNMTLRSLETIQEITARTNYAHSARKVLIERQAEIQALVAEVIAESAHLGWFNRTFLFDRVRDRTAETVMEILLCTLDKEATHAIVVDIVNQAINDIEAQLLGREMEKELREASSEF